jgi:hypothetical protein
MTELLAEAKRARVDFDVAWAAAWLTMRRERAWPHATVSRHEWQAAVEGCREEYRAAYLGIDTAYSRMHVMVTTLTIDEALVAGEIDYGALIA